MPKRCSWVSNSPLYEHYHDSEWGRPTYDDQQLFEMLMLRLSTKSTNRNQTDRKRLSDEECSRGKMRIERGFMSI
jgi:3-methyladenine DNA glycosylase Tag